MRSAHAEISILKSNSEIEIQSLREQIRNLETLAADKDNMLKEVISEFRIERKKAQTLQARVKRERDALRTRIMNLEVRMASPEANPADSGKKNDVPEMKM